MQLRSGLTVPGPQPGPAAPAPGPFAGAAPGTPDVPQREAAFREGVRLCLARWTALQLAVENQWGGRRSAQKAEELAQNILAWFAERAHKRGADGTPRFYADELEDFLDEAVLQAFNMDADDGSLQEVSESLMQAHEECRVGDFATVLQWQQKAQEQQQRGRTSTAQSVRQPTDEDDLSEDSMEEGGPEGGGRKCEGDAMATDEQPVLAKEPGASSGSQGKEHTPRAGSQLSQQEVDDGWQHVPTRRSGRKR